MIFDLKNYDTFRDSYMDLNGNKVCSVTVEWYLKTRFEIEPCFFMYLFFKIYGYI
jgi:hypothetical protein